MPSTVRRGRPATGKALPPAERMRRYRARQRAAGLKPSTTWQAVAAAPLPHGALRHRVIEARSLAMHSLIALKIAAKPALLGKVRRILEGWRSRYGRNVPRPFDEWHEILQRPWVEIAAFMTDAGERATRLRQSTPFVGILSEAERRRVYRAFVLEGVTQAGTSST